MTLPYDTLRDFLRASLGEKAVVPGVVASVQTFGSLLNWHPHLHFLVTDGAYRDDGTFQPLSFHDPTALTEAFRRAILGVFVDRGFFTPETADSMLAWPHSGFHVHHHVRIQSDDATGRAHRFGQGGRTHRRRPHVRCAGCGGTMEILAFTLDPADIDATLRTLRNKGVDPQAGPWTARAPPTLAA